MHALAVYYTTLLQYWETLQNLTIQQIAKTSKSSYQKHVRTSIWNKNEIFYEKYLFLPIEKTCKQQLCMMAYKIDNDLFKS